VPKKTEKKKITLDEMVAYLHKRGADHQLDMSEATEHEIWVQYMALKMSERSRD